MHVSRRTRRGEHRPASGSRPAPSRRRVLTLGGITAALLGACSTDEQPAPEQTTAPPPPQDPAELAAWHAAIAQAGLVAFFEAPSPQLLHYAYPEDPAADAPFHYWWNAHAIDAAVDAWERTQDEADLERAQQLRENLVLRNGDDLVNDFFDDMGWFALALLRLFHAAQDESALTDAITLHDHIWDLGWSTQGGGIVWEKGQYHYKNTPANGPFVIAGHRLHRATGEARFLERARASLQWWEETLVAPNGFVYDGINRNRDGKIDLEWRFTYNQGLYVGACVEEYRTDGTEARLERAAATIDVTLDQLSDGEVLLPDGDGGDAGLFAGIFYRYAGQLLAETEHDALSRFLVTSTEALFRNQYDGSGALLAGDDWSQPAPAASDLSTQLSAVMATEVAAAQHR
jgi:predicted alpha-1,6-mannanase (GH76 family)